MGRSQYNKVRVATTIPNTIPKQPKQKHNKDGPRLPKISCITIDTIYETFLICFWLCIRFAFHKRTHGWIGKLRSIRQCFRCCFNPRVRLVSHFLRQGNRLQMTTSCNDLNMPFAFVWTFNFPSLHKFSSRWFFGFSLVTPREGMYSISVLYGRCIKTMQTSSTTEHKISIQLLWWRKDFLPLLRRVAIVSALTLVLGKYQEKSKATHSHYTQFNAQAQTKAIQAQCIWLLWRRKLPSNNANTLATIISRTNCLQRRKDTWVMVNSIVIHAELETYPTQTPKMCIRMSKSLTLSYCCVIKWLCSLCIHSIHQQKHPKKESDTKTRAHRFYAVVECLLIFRRDQAGTIYMWELKMSNVDFVIDAIQFSLVMWKRWLITPLIVVMISIYDHCAADDSIQFSCFFSCFSNHSSKDFRFDFRDFDFIAFSAFLFLLRL